MASTYRRPPSHLSSRGRGTAKLALIKSKTERCKQMLGPAGFHADEFALTNVRKILNEIVDLCEEESP